MKWQQRVECKSKIPNEKTADIGRLGILVGAISIADGKRKIQPRGLESLAGSRLVVSANRGSTDELEHNETSA
jgi:hypothetical protein